MKLLFLTYVGDYSYSFQGSFKLIPIAVTISLSFEQEQVTGNTYPLGIFKNLVQLLLHDLIWFSNLKCNDFEKNGIWDLDFLSQKNLRRLELSISKTSRTQGGDKVQAVLTPGSWQVCLCQ